MSGSDDPSPIKFIVENMTGIGSSLNGTTFTRAGFDGNGEPLFRGKRRDGTAWWFYTDGAGRWVLGSTQFKNACQTADNNDFPDDIYAAFSAPRRTAYSIYAQ